jgi:four helix bundle protein
MQKYNSKFKTDLYDRCFKLSINIIKLTDSFPNKRAFWIISDQLIRSSTSIGANLTEGRASSTKREFKKFQEIALKSANESKYWLELLLEVRKEDADKIKILNQEVHEISSMIAAGILKLKGKR